MPGTELIVRDAVGSSDIDDYYISSLVDVNQKLYGGQVEIHVLSILLNIKITQLVVTLRPLKNVTPTLRHVFS